MIYRQFWIGGLLAAALLAPAARAAEGGDAAADASEKTNPLAATATLATDYVYRGISQNSNRPAYQATAEYDAPASHGVGLLAGGFISNVNFGPGQGVAELSPYAGFTWTGAVSGRTQVYYDVYAGAPPALHENYYGVDTTFSHDFGPAPVSLEVDIAPDFFGNSGLAVYGGLDTSIPLRVLPFKPNLVLHGGHQWIERNLVYGAPDDFDWAAELNVDIRHLHLALRYSDTSLSREACFGGQKTCGSRAIASATWNF